MVGSLPVDRESFSRRKILYYRQLFVLSVATFSTKCHRHRTSTATFGSLIDRQAPGFFFFSSPKRDLSGVWTAKGRKNAWWQIYPVQISLGTFSLREAMAVRVGKLRATVVVEISSRYLRCTSEITNIPKSIDNGLSLPDRFQHFGARFYPRCHTRNWFQFG